MVITLDRTDNLTFSLVKLQRLGASFDSLRDGRPASRAVERQALRLAGDLGATAVPMLLRSLAAPDDARSRWAYALLLVLAGNDACGDRVIESIRAHADRPGAPGALRSRATALLAELGGEPHDCAASEDPSALRDQSLRELAACLDTPAEVARAADLLVHQLDDDELLNFIDEFAMSESRRAAAVIDELLVRDDIEERTRSELRRLRAPLSEPTPADRVSAPARPTVRIARHPDGREIVVVSARRASARPVRYRAMWALVDARGAMVDAGYRAELTGGAIERDLLEPMRDEGFDVQRAPARRGAAKVIAGARTRIATGGELPRDYYLGRDLLAIFQQHWDDHSVAGAEPDDNLTVMLARALDLLSVGELARARPLLERYVAHRPEDPEGLSNLGVCLMATGDYADACAHLARAADAEPSQSMHYWNLAAAAHRSGQLGRCYLALDAYMDRIDARPDAHQRRSAARELIAEYERFARVEYPGVDPYEVAQREVTAPSEGLRSTHPTR
jgi:tetratricopeptide (TPR) repeat protein